MGEITIALLANANASRSLRHWTGVSKIQYERLSSAISHSAGEAEDHLQRFYESGCRSYLFLGGDGTIFQGINFLCRLNGGSLEGIVIGAMNGGSGNGLAKVAGAGHPSKDLHNISSCKEIPVKPVPLIEVTAEDVQGNPIGPLSYTFAGVGVDALIAKYYQESSKGGLSAYLKSVPKAFPVLLNGHYPYAQVEGSNVQERTPQGSKNLFSPATSNDGPSTLDGKLVHSIVVGTVPYYGYGFKAFPYAEEASLDGKMHVRIGKGHVFREALRYLNNAHPLWRGRFSHENLVELFAEKITAHSVHERLYLQVAGDYLGQVRTVCFQLSKSMSLIDFEALRKR
ncbi:hypothetical protein HYX12_00570 [Candidatus Woesearchaeota archaeon]|nr:hypothetical protein [Candidatus Woesearchaeota archaeon]